MDVGVLALQGGFHAHGRMLEELGCNYHEVRTETDLYDIEALIIPGGESTTMLKLMEDFKLFDPLNEFAQTGKPILGTCAGAILMCEKVNNRNQRSLGWIPATVDRNAYGSQQFSFEETVDCWLWDLRDIPVCFIRAPRFIDLGDGVQELSKSKGEVTGVVYKNFTAVTYHPELGDDTRFHKTWLEQNNLGRDDKWVYG